MAVRDGLRQASAASDAMRHFNGCAVSPPRDHIVTRYIEERAISLHSARVTENNSCRLHRTQHQMVVLIISCESHTRLALLSILLCLIISYHQSRLSVRLVRWLLRRQK